MSETQGYFGGFRYTHIYSKGLGHRFEWETSPPPGTKVICGEEIHAIDGIGMAGLIEHTGPDGCQHASFPLDLEINEEL